LNITNIITLKITSTDYSVTLTRILSEFYELHEFLFLATNLRIWRIYECITTTDFSYGFTDFTN
jgi:hypothetical protein